MRPVARIAQSVEQGIENPRVLGSIPSPGTTNLENPSTRRVFAFGEPDSPSNCVRFTRRIPATRPAGSAMRCAKTLPAFLSGPGTTNLENPSTRRVFAFGEPDSPSNCVRFTRRIPATRPAGSAMRCAKTLPAFLSGPGTTNLKNPPIRRVFAFGEPDSSSNCVRFTRRIPATRPAGSAMRCAKTLPAFLSGPGTTNLKNPPTRRVFAFGEPDSPSNCVRFTRRIPATRPAGSAMRCAKTLPLFSPCNPPLLR